MGLARLLEQMGDFLAVLELFEQLADALKVGGRRLVEQIGLAADDQHRPLGCVLAPAGEAGSDQLGCGGIKCLASFGDLSAQPCLGLGQSQTSKPAANVIADFGDRKSTRLNSSHLVNSYAVFCMKKK